MATRKSTQQSNGSAPPTELAVQAATPPPTTITAPDGSEFFSQYRQVIAPLEAFQVVDNNSFVAAGLAFTKVGNWIDAVEAAFAPAKKAANQAHKAITTLEAMFVGPAAAVKENLTNQVLAWREKLETERRAEEARLQREQQAKAELERQRLQVIADAEAEDRRQQAAEREAELMPWEEAEAIPEPEQVIVPLAEVPEVRLPSPIPTVMGLNYRSTPWKARIDLKALVIEAGKRAEGGDDSLLQYLEAREPMLNALAREHGNSISMIVPGVTAYRETGLARG
jgi:hypothetical protein